MISPLSTHMYRWRAAREEFLVPIAILLINDCDRSGHNNEQWQLINYKAETWE